MTIALFLSPHLDDAVLSCAGRILRHAGRGERVVLLTVFSHADPLDTADWAARRREDERAATRLGAHPQWLGLPDAPFRDPRYASFDSAALTGPLAAGDHAWRERLAARLAAEVAAARPESLYLPLGVGCHVDHRLVHEATAALEGAWRRYYYEDQPYALVPQASDRRLAALALGSLHAELEALDATAAALAEQAIWDYASQAPALFGTHERYRARVRAHAERLGATASRAERYWRVSPRRRRPSCR